MSADSTSQSPRTPIRELTALALNFQQSPPHCLMPDILDRKPSNSSSLVVLHSSPVNIPTPVTHENIGCAHLHGLPEGTVPDSPAPLRKALERDPNRYSIVSDSSPARSQFGGNPELTASPMPETNLGLRDNDFGESPALSRGQEAELSMVPLEAASYFDTSMAVHSTNSNLDSVGRAAVQQKGAMILEKILDDKISYEGASTVANLYKLNKTGIHGEHVYRHDSSVTMQNSSLTEHNRTEDAKSLESTVNGQTQRDEIDPMRQETSPNNIEHIVSEDPTSSNTYHQPAHLVYLIRQPETQTSLEMQARTLSASNSLHIIEPAPASTAWGTRGSLYDGTGYGDASSSISTRPSTSATVPKEHTKSAVDSTHTAATVTQGPISMTRDHETFDEVIRAHGALGEEAIAGVTKDA
jgi:hypothetical protein